MSNVNRTGVYAFAAAVTLLMTMQANACDTNAKIGLKLYSQEINEISSNDEKAELLNLRTGKCEVLSSAKSDADLSVFLPLDETSIGLLTDYRSAGYSRPDALKHVLAVLE